MAYRHEFVSKQTKNYQRCPETGMKYSQLLELLDFLLLLLFFENELRLLTEIIDNIISFISRYQIVQIRLCKDRPKDFARSWGTANQL